MPWITFATDTGNYTQNYTVSTGSSSNVYYANVVVGTGSYQSIYYQPTCQVYVTGGTTSITCNFEETAEQKAAREEQAEKRKHSEARAETLLLEHLSEKQIEQYQKHGYFETEVNAKIYRIKKGRSGNVLLVEGDKPKYRYCAHPSAWTPDQDVMLSQLLMLHSDEAKFLAVANRTVLN